MPMQNRYIMCCHAAESGSHLFIHCEVVCSVWWSMFEVIYGELGYTKIHEEIDIDMGSWDGVSLK